MARGKDSPVIIGMLITIGISLIILGVSMPWLISNGKSQRTSRFTLLQISIINDSGRSYQFHTFKDSETNQEIVCGPDSCWLTGRILK